MTSRTRAFLFCDLARSDALPPRLGDDAADPLRRAVLAPLRSEVLANHGEVVKVLGDGLMASFSSAADAVSCAVAMQQAIHELGRSEAGEALGLRVGVSAGEAAQEEEGDWFGTPVVEAARLCACAGGGQVLVSDIARELTATRRQQGFVPVGSLELKGIPEPVPAYEVPWEPLLEAPSEPPPAASVPLPERLQSTAPFGFFGRQAEREVISAAWKQAAAGHRQLVLLAGEPGIGKTGLATDFAQQVHSEGATVLYGRCDEELRVPYQPFVEALRGYVADGDEGGLTEWAELHGGGALSRLVPELSLRFPGAGPTRSTDPETERYLLFQAVSSLLATLSRPGPALLVLDDLHWAAKPTLLLLRHIVNSAEPMGLLVLGTYRETEISRSHPLGELLADFRREPSVERLSLSGLGDDEIVALVESAAGHVLDDAGVALAHAVHAESDGNPFFVVQTLRHLDESGALVRREGRWVAAVDPSRVGLPASVREVIGHRVGRLGDEATEVLSLAAVIGRDFDLDLLTRVTELSEDRLLDLLDQATSAAVVYEVTARPGWYTFSHALVQHALYEDLGPTRRLRAHHRVASALEELLGEEPLERVGELARHWMAATRPVDAAKAIDYALQAGDRALAQLAPEEAVGWYAQALELHEGVLDGDELRCDVLIRLGEAQRRAGQPTFRETLLHAAHLARRLDDTGRLLRAALANNRGIHSATGVVDEERVGVLEAAAAAVGEHHSAARALVLATLAAELTFARDWERRRALADEALAVARRVGDDATLARVLNLRQETIQVPDTLPERLANTAECLVLTERLDDPFERFWATECRLRAVAEADVLTEEVDHLLDELDRLAQELGQPALSWYVAFHRSWRELQAGHPAEAERLAVEALQIGNDSGQPEAMAIFASVLICLRRDQGRLDEVESLIAQAVADNPGIPAFRALLAVCYCELDRFDDARAVFAVDAANGFADIPYDMVWSSGLSLYAEVCAFLGDAGAAAVLAEQLRPYGGSITHAGAVMLGAVDRYVGLLETTLGNLDEAEARFAAAAELHERIAAPVWLARTHLDWATLLERREGPGDRERAQRLLEQSLEATEAIGCAALARRARRALGQLDVDSG
jgi:class 3 adenylate cyclase/tetratricopeptide (TPR) repeat protein